METEDKNTSSDKSVQDSSLIRKKHGTDALRRMNSAISGEFPALKRNGSESNASTATEIKEESGKSSKEADPKELDSPKNEDSSKLADSPKAESPKSEDSSKEVEFSKEVESVKVVESPKEVEVSKAFESPKEADSPKDEDSAKDVNPFQKLKETASGEFKPITVPSAEVIQSVKEEMSPLVWAEKSEFRQKSDNSGASDNVSNVKGDLPKSDTETKLIDPKLTNSGRSQTDLPKVGLPRPGAPGAKITAGKKGVLPTAKTGTTDPNVSSQGINKSTVSGDNKKVEPSKLGQTSQRNTSEFKKIDMPEFGFSSGRAAGSRPPSSFEKLKQGWADASAKTSAASGTPAEAAKGSAGNDVEQAKSSTPVSPKPGTLTSPKPTNAAPPPVSISLERHQLDHSTRATKHSLAALSNWETTESQSAAPSISKISSRMADKKVQKMMVAAVGVIAIIGGFVYWILESDKSNTYDAISKEIKEQKFKEAVEGADVALKKYGDNPRLYALKAQAEESLGNLPKANEDYTAALAKDPQNVELLTHRASVNLALGKDANAIADLNRILAVPSLHTVENLDKRARALIKTGNYGAAEADIKEALKKDAKNTATKHTLALLQARQGKYQDSIRTCNELLKGNSEDYEALAQRGFAWFRTGQLSKAKADLKKSLSIFDTVDGFEYSAMVARAEKDNTAYVEFLTKASYLDPNNMSLKTQKAETLIAAKKYAEAVTALDEIAAADASTLPKDFYIRKAGLEKNLGKYKEACSDYSKAIEQNPDKLDLLANRAECADKAGMMSIAIGDYDHLIAHKPADWIYLKRGGAYAKLNQIRAAEADFDKVSRMNPKSKEPYKYKAKYYLSALNYDAARVNNERALKLDPRDPECLEMAKKLSSMKRVISLSSPQPVAQQQQTAPPPNIASMTPTALIAEGEKQVKSGSLQQAVGYFAQAVKLNPSDCSARRHIAYAQFALSQYEDAAKQFEALKAMGANSPADDEKYKQTLLRAKALQDQSSSNSPGPPGSAPPIPMRADGSPAIHRPAE